MALLETLLTERVLDTLIERGFQAAQAGLSWNEVADALAGWKASGMTGEQVADAMLSLRKANRADADRALKDKGA